jgi:hypothetical protein
MSDVFEADGYLSKGPDPLRVLVHQPGTEMLKDVIQEVDLAIRGPGSILRCGECRHSVPRYWKPLTSIRNPIGGGASAGDIPA